MHKHESTSQYLSWEFKSLFYSTTKQLSFTKMWSFCLIFIMHTALTVPFITIYLLAKTDLGILRLIQCHLTKNHNYNCVQ